MPHKPCLLAIIGGGNMGRAIMSGAISARLLAHNEIVVCEPDTKRRDELSRWGVQSCAGLESALNRLALPPPESAREFISEGWPGAFGGQVLLAVKPQSLGEIVPALGEHLAKTPRVVISILAGTPTAKIARALGVPAPIVRAMPNTPARLRKGVTALCRAPGVTDGQAQFAFDLFMSLGEVIKIDEGLMDAFTALAGSGPAYVFYLAEAMVRAAQKVGFDRITADRVVRQTISGAAELLMESNEPPEALRAAVTSKGGTTEAAVGELERSGVLDAVVRAIVAGRDRGRELGG